MISLRLSNLVEGRILYSPRKEGFVLSIHDDDQRGFLSCDGSL